MTLLQIAIATTKNPAFQPKGGQTFCNFGIQMIAEAWFGTDSLNGLTANAIHDKISKQWRKVSAEDAANLAKSCFVIASQKSEAHGHVATVLPLPLVTSGKWNAKVPQVANVGKTNGVMGVNFAFTTEPEYFVKP